MRFVSIPVHNKTSGFKFIRVVIDGRAFTIRVATVELRENHLGLSAFLLRGVYQGKVVSRKDMLHLEQSMEIC